MTSLVRQKKKALERKNAPEFSDHGSFHGAVIRAVGGAATGGLLASIIDILSTAVDLGALGDPVFFIMAAAGALAAVGGRGKKWLKALMGGGLGALGAGLAFAAMQWPVFAGALLGLAAAPVLAAGESNKRKGLTALLASGFAGAGLYVGKVMLGWGFLTTLVPVPLSAAIAGAAAGLFFGLSAAPKYLARPMDPVETAYLEALHTKDGELHEILSRALSIHSAVRSDLENRKSDASLGQLGTRVSELMMRILHISTQCRRIESDMAAAPAYELEERISSLKRKADAASDTAARNTYMTAIESLDGQRRALESVSRGRERVIARLHANVALLEKVRFSLLHLRSADAERFGGEITPVTNALEELGREIDATSTAIGEVYGDADLPLPAEFDNVVKLEGKTSAEPNTQPQLAEKTAEKNDEEHETRLDAPRVVDQRDPQA